MTIQAASDVVEMQRRTLIAVADLSGRLASPSPAGAEISDYHRRMMPGSELGSAGTNAERGPADASNGLACGKRNAPR